MERTEEPQWNATEPFLLYLKAAGLSYVDASIAPPSALEGKRRQR